MSPRWSNFHAIQVIVFALLLFSAGIASAASKRVALVIGNSAYRYADELANPLNDAADLADYLKTIDFLVIEGFELDKIGFDRKLQEFAAALHGAQTGVFFYAGHGLQVAGQNFLVPVDAKLSTEGALDFETVRLDLVQRTMQREAQTSILFLDACRNNPLQRNLVRAMGARYVQIGRGFSPVQAGADTLINFSTEPGKVALDGRGRNSPFTGALIKYLATSSYDLSSVLMQVRSDVMDETNGQQVPWEHSSLRTKFYFNPALQNTAPVTPAIGVSELAVRSARRAVDIGDFSVHPGNDEELTLLKTLIEGAFVDLFVEKRVRTTHKSSAVGIRAMNGWQVAGDITRNSSMAAEISLRLTSPDGAILASTSAAGKLAMLKESYKSIPEALMFLLGISPYTLEKVETPRRPTSSFGAMVSYLDASRFAKLNELNKALASLQEAVKDDPQFAMAYWAYGQVLRAMGSEREAQEWEMKASKTDPDHARSFRVGNVGNPLPSLRNALLVEDWRSLRKGLAFKSVKSSSYQIAIHAWRLDPAEFRLSVARAPTEIGSTVTDLRAEHKAVLAVNGGYFDKDTKSRLSPSGLLVVDGRQISAMKEKGGSGIVFSRNGTIDIDFIGNVKDIRSIEAAVQVGPLVVDPGGRNGIHQNDFDRQKRSIICRQFDGTIIVVAIDGGLSLYEAGELLASSENDGGFACDRALNLDGGPSTQVSFAVGEDALEIQGRWKVHNALIFLPR
jgi:tetratricopeptide (TPR) repeat protein